MLATTERAETRHRDLDLWPTPRLEAASVEPDEARAALEAASWSIKTAMLCYRHPLDAAAARACLAASGGALRAALTSCEGR